MSAKAAKQSPQVPGAAAIRPSALAWRMAESLPLPERRKLALRLIEDDAEEIVFRRGGATWVGFVWDRIVSGNLFAYGSFQRTEIRAVLDWMRWHRRLGLNRVIVDVGANIGTSAIPFARETPCRVVAIEPVPELYAMLCRNILGNGLGNRIEPMEVAISAGKARRVRVVLPCENSGAAEVVLPGRRPSFAGALAERSRASVPAAGLDALLKRRRIAAKNVAFVWADVQGFESHVMASAGKLWAAGVPLFCEISPALWGNAGDPRAFLREAARHFTGFIPSAVLIAEKRPAVRPIAELPAFCRGLVHPGTDALFLNDRNRL
jgi:FkbM family methyltransferase